MSFDGKISNILCVLGTVVSLSLLITLLATGGAVWLYVAAGLLAVIFVMLILTAKKSKLADTDTTACPSPQTAAEPVESQADAVKNLSCQIRTPLSNIVSVAELMSRDVNSDNKKMLADSLVASVETINDLLNTVDGERSGNPLDKAFNDQICVFDLRSLITQTAELTPGVEVKVEVYGELPRLKGNSVKMRRILLSIFDFFLQHTPKDSLPAHVTIVVNRVRIPITPVKYRFDVKSDLGISIDDPDAEIAELNIARRLIGELKGNIKHRFEDGNAFVYFNVCFDGEETAAADSVSAAVQTGQMEVSTNETAGFATVTKPRAKTLEEADIIVCDDNPINQKVMSLSLDKHVKSIALASNGQECVELVSRGRYDLILMDIQMPVLDGYEATVQIRKRERDRNAAHLPIIAVTANTMSGDRQHCLEIGMDDYISKPFQIEDVIRKMKEQLEKHPMR